MDKLKLAKANALSADIQNHQDTIDDLQKERNKQFPPHVDQPKSYQPKRDILLTIGNASITVSELYVTEAQMTEIVDGSFDWLIRTIKMNKEKLEKEFKAM